MCKSIARFMKNEDGATAIEYVLIAGATGLALAAVMPNIGTGLDNTFTPIAAGL